VGYPSRDGQQPDFRNDLLEGETENGDAKIVPKLRWTGSIGRISSRLPKKWRKTQKQAQRRAVDLGELPV
jgi:hypothetical protein